MYFRLMTGKLVYFPRLDKIYGSMGLSCVHISDRIPVYPENSGVLESFETPGSSLSLPTGGGRDAQNRSPRGWGGLPAAGKRLIEDGAAWLYRYRVKNVGNGQWQQLVEWTITTPTHYLDGTPISPAEQLKIQQNWSFILDRVKIAVRRLQEKQGIDQHFLYVTEVQTERWEVRGELGLHSHFLLMNIWDTHAERFIPATGQTVKGAYKITTEMADNIIQSAFQALLGKPVDCRAAGHMGTISSMGQLASYMAKTGRIARYLSKGSQIMGELRDAAKRGEIAIPKSWYGSDSEQRDDVRLARIRVENLGFDSIDDFNAYLDGLDEEFFQQNGRRLLTKSWYVYRDGFSNPVAYCRSLIRFTDIVYLALALGLRDHIPIDLLEEYERKNSGVPPDSNAVDPSLILVLESLLGQQESPSLIKG